MIFLLLLLLLLLVLVRVQVVARRLLLFPVCRRTAAPNGPRLTAHMTLLLCIVLHFFLYMRVGASKHTQTKKHIFAHTQHPTCRHTRTAPSHARINKKKQHVWRT